VTRLAAILLPLGVILSTALASDAVTISQHNRKFSPSSVTIARGTTLHIVNDDRVTHHVYVESPSMNFDSGEQPVGTSVDLRFDHDGLFAVRCAIHPTMRLNVTVK
jgi:cytochrome c peroxidase